MINRRAVRHNVQASKMCVDGFDPFKDRLSIAHVALQGNTFRILPCYGLPDALSRLSIDIDTDNIATCLRKGTRSRLTQAAASARHKGNLTFQGGSIHSLLLYIVYL